MNPTDAPPHDARVDRRNNQDRWVAVAAAVQAASTLGMFVIALVGLWNVQPIITYQLERQAREERQAESARLAPVAVRAQSAVAARFVGEIATWWRERVDGYERILELIGQREVRGTRVTFAVGDYPGLLPDTTEPRGGLSVTATLASGETERVRVPVNDAAVSPAQYVQYRVNHGAFADLAPEARKAVEDAVMLHTTQFMMPVPPPRVRPGMALEAVYDELESARDHRLDASKDIEALATVIDQAVAAAANGPAR